MSRFDDFSKMPVRDPDRDRYLVSRMITSEGMTENWIGDLESPTFVEYHKFIHCEKIDEPFKQKLFK